MFKEARLQVPEVPPGSQVMYSPTGRKKMSEVLEDFVKSYRDLARDEKRSALSNMKGLRISYQGEPWRILFAFDPERSAILLVGGNKGGDKRWYQEQVPIADRRFRQHLDSLEREGED